MLYFDKILEGKTLKEWLKKDSARTLTICICFYWTAGYTYSSVLTPYASSLGASAALCGLIVGSYGLAQTLLRLPLGIVSSLLQKRKPFIMSAMLIGAISPLLMALFPSAWGLFFFRALAGVSASAYVTFTVLYSSYVSSSKTTNAVGKLMSYSSMAQLIAITVGGQLIRAYSEKAAFYMAFICGTIGFALSFFISDQKSDKPPLSISALLAVCKDKRLIAVSFLAILMQCVNYSTIFGFTPAWAAERITKDAGLISLLSTVFLLTNMIGARTAAHLSLKFKPQIIISFGFTMISCGVMLVPFCTSIYMLYLAQIFSGVGTGFCLSMLMGTSIQHIPDEKRDAAMGFFQAVYGIGMFGGPVIAGWIIKNSGLEINFYIMAGVAAMAVVLSVILLGGKKRVR
jgi:Arabinose efflux permease